MYEVLKRNDFEIVTVIKMASTKIHNIFNKVIITDRVFKFTENHEIDFNMSQCETF